MKLAPQLLGFMGLLALGGCGTVATADPIGQYKPKFQAPKAKNQDQPMNVSELYVAAGCFWCIEAIYDDLEGVVECESGYAGGSKAGVTYAEVCSGLTGHAEVVRIKYDADKLDPKDLLRLFFTIHDPTQLNRQGPDVGTQYRSAVFFRTAEEKQMAQEVMKEIADAKIWPNKIVTTLEPLKNYTRAEEYHQDYFVKFEKASPMERMKMNAGYCQAIVAPKVLKFRKEFKDKLKKKG
jgi:peptide-methionine (S)-S-oxide reductase